MKIIGMTTVRDEADILRESLEAWSNALDRVFVIDCGSIDDSVAIIQDVASRRNNVEFIAQLGPIYSEKFRYAIWSNYVKEYSSQDWWLVADSDEFVQEDFRPILERATKQGADHVFSEHINHYMTESQHTELQKELEESGDYRKPIRERLKHYRMHVSMIRFARICPWIRWEPDDAFPCNLAVPGKERIKFYHYQYRNPEQIKNRVITRASFNSPEHAAYYAANPHWLKEKTADAISPDEDPNIKLWTPESGYIADPAMPSIPQCGTLKAFLKKGKSMLYGLTHPQQGMPVKDIKKKYPAEHK